MSDMHRQHENHSHRHEAGCGHTAVKHADPVDYLHEGHLHHLHDGHVDECELGADATNPARCTPSHACKGHAVGHVHGPSCGHEIVHHNGHTDYLVDGHLHHPHSGHCDEHGPMLVA